MSLPTPYFRTELGELHLADAVAQLSSGPLDHYHGKVNLLMTSPPFPLNTKKRYGNLQGDAYREWFTGLGPLFENFLAEDGSLVIEIGNAWEAGRPVQSLLHLECLLGLVKNSGLRLIQEFVSYNPSKLPSPAQWVTVNRLRTVDSYTHVWWLAKSDYPKADNSRTLRPYSKSMQRLLARQSYNAGDRPSEHRLSEGSFLKDQGGSIAHNFFELEPLVAGRDPRLPHNVLRFSNTASNDQYMRACREQGVRPHPARMNAGIVSFFVNFLTDPGDLVLDPFAGSNTTGATAEALQRRWLSLEIDPAYAEQSRLRFD